MELSAMFFKIFNRLFEKRNVITDQANGAITIVAQNSPDATSDVIVVNGNHNAMIINHLCLGLSAYATLSIKFMHQFFIIPEANFIFLAKAKAKRKITTFLTVVFSPVYLLFASTFFTPSLQATRIFGMLVKFAKRINLFTSTAPFLSDGNSGATTPSRIMTNYIFKGLTFNPTRVFPIARSYFSFLSTSTSTISVGDCW